MDLSFYVYSFLQERGKGVEVPHFGSFSLKKTPARMDEKASKILPPTEVVSFEKRDNQSYEIANFISEKTGNAIEVVSKEVDIEVKKWSRKLSLNQRLELENLGVIEVINGGDIVFTPALKNNFGLEEIDLNEITPFQNGKTFGKVILWTFLVVLPLVALVVLGLEFSNFSFDNFSIQNTKRIEDKPKVIEIPKDTIKKDTILPSVQLNDIKQDIE